GVGKLRDRIGETPREQRTEQDGDSPRDGAPDERVADHLVDGSKSQLAVTLDQNSPGRLPDRRDRGENRSPRRILGTRQASGKPHEIGDKRGRQSRLLPQRKDRAAVPANQGDPHFAVSLVAKPLRQRLPGNQGFDDTEARLGLSENGQREHGDRAQRRQVERLTLIDRPVARGLEAPPKLKIDFRQMNVGTEEAPLALEVEAPKRNGEATM